jgi:hypothetical protein
MFGKPKPEGNPEFPNPELSPPPMSETSQPQKAALSRQTDSEKSELVNTVERISRIVSPYFIVLVGLFLYEDNFLMGTVLIAIGILSLLKVSWQDITAVFDRLKKVINKS